MIRRTSLALALCLLAVAACKSRDDKAPPPAPAPVAGSGSGSGADSGSATKNVYPSKDLTALASRMSYEAQHRPGVGPTAEQVFDALEKAGITLTGREQYLGKTMHAEFCAGGLTATGVVVASCEYATPEDAKAGMEFANKTFPGTAATVRQVHRAAVLTITTQKPDPAVTGPAFAAFNAL